MNTWLAEPSALNKVKQVSTPAVATNPNKTGAIDLKVGLEFQSHLVLIFFGSAKIIGLSAGRSDFKLGVFILGRLINAILQF